MRLAPFVERRLASVGEVLETQVPSRDFLFDQNVFKRIKGNNLLAVVQGLMESVNNP